MVTFLVSSPPCQSVNVSECDISPFLFAGSRFLELDHAAGCGMARGRDPIIHAGALPPGHAPCVRMEQPAGHVSCNDTVMAVGAFADGCKRTARRLQRRVRLWLFFRFPSVCVHASPRPPSPAGFCFFRGREPLKPCTCRLALPRTARQKTTMTTDILYVSNLVLPTLPTCTIQAYQCLSLISTASTSTPPLNQRSPSSILTSFPLICLFRISPFSANVQSSNP